MNLFARLGSTALALVACVPQLPALPASATGSTMSTGDDGDAEVSTTGELDSTTSGDPSGGGASDSTPTTSDSTDTSSDDGSANTTTSWVNPPDAGFDLDECSVWAQDCPEGWKCMPWANDGGNSWNDTRCTELDPVPGQTGDPCTVEGTGVSGVDDCTIAAMCWNVNPETNEGTCIALCTGSEAAPTCDDPATACSISNEGVLTLCLRVCDPLMQDCGGSEGCYMQGGGTGFVCTPDASNGKGLYPLECGFVNACAPGHACLEAEMVPGCADGCCSPYCDTSDTDPCPAIDPSLQCVPWYEAGQAPPGYENVGVCAIPQ
jgi:hypothetical protein